MNATQLTGGSLALNAGATNVRTLRFRKDGRPWGKAEMPIIEMTDRAVNKPPLGRGAYKINGFAWAAADCIA